MSHPPILNYSPDRPPQLEQPCMRDGIYLVTQREVSLPQHCIICGQPATDPVKHFVRLPTEIALANLRDMVLLRYRGAVKMQLWYCPRHVGPQRRIKHIGYLAAFLLCLGLASEAFFSASIDACVSAAVTVVIALLAGAAQWWYDRGKPRFHHAIGNHFYFTGVDEAFLRHLPGNA